MSEAAEKLRAVEQTLENKYSTSPWEIALKVLYRLSAVIFLMLLAKEAIKQGVGALSVAGRKPTCVQVPASERCV